MKLYDILKTAKFNAPFAIYITNAYDQNLLIGHGIRNLVIDEESTTVFDHLMDDVERWCIGVDGTMCVFIIDENYEKRCEEIFPMSDKWGNSVDKRPWRHGIETLEYTDKYIRVVEA